MPSRILFSSAASRLSEVSRLYQVSPLRQVRQLATIRLAAGGGHPEYLKYRLWRPEIDDVTRLTYAFRREKDALQSVNNFAGLPRPTEAKSDMLARLADAGIPQPELLARVRDEPADNGITSEAGLGEFLDLNGNLPLVFKPELGSRGSGVLVARSADRAGVLLVSGAALPIQALWELLATELKGGWRVERWVIPHPLVAGWRDGVTPTLRLVTLQVAGEVVVHCASVKVPVGDSGVDNLAQGNLAAPVDLATGQVAAATDESGVVEHAQHPDSGAAIEGISIPGWDEYLATVRRGAKALSEYPGLGWDVAVTAGGPVVLEANDKWGLGLPQLATPTGIVRGAFIRLLHEAGATQVLERRRKWVSAWRAFEERELRG